MLIIPIYFKFAKTKNENPISGFSQNGEKNPIWF